jgi:hypothetical protein
MGALTVGATLTGLGLTAAALDPPDAAGVSADGTLTGTAVDLAAAGLGAPVPVARIDTVPAAVPVGGIVAANAPAVQVPSVQLPIVQAPTVQTPALLTTALETSSLQNSPVQPVVNQLSSVGSTVVPMVRNALPPAVTQPLAATGLLSSITPITPQSVASQPTLVNAPAPLPLPALPALAPVTSAAQALPSNVTALVHGVAGLL